MSHPTDYACLFDDFGLYCARCDLLVGLAGFHVVKVRHADEHLVIDIESGERFAGCPSCGVMAKNKGRRVHQLVDSPCFGTNVILQWRKRTWRCVESECPVGVFTEQDERVCRPRALLSTRACWWALKQLRRENTSVRGLARQLGTTWRTVWNSIKPILEHMDTDPNRFDDVFTLGVDEHIVRHEALLFRMEVRDLDRLVVVTAG